MSTTQAPPTNASAMNAVFRDAIHAETVRKEMKRYKVYEQYMLTPSVEKGLVVTEKPNRVSIQNMEKSLDLDSGKKPGITIDHGQTLPRTTNETYGWDTIPLMRNTDGRFYHPKIETEITKMYGTIISTGGSKGKVKEAQ
ncbi:hypothetical protein SpCBS45565_g00980 [Spizellomyces sp. 'palustris']|nr:hypothetical protein SpCBS45565_g00980 [Spizellomyces sp. 'palustris']